MKSSPIKAVLRGSALFLLSVFAATDLIADEALPVWAHTLPESPDTAYGVGVAALTEDRAEAIASARASARSELAKGLSLILKSRLSVRTEAANGRSSSELLNQIDVSVPEVALSDVVVREVHVSEESQTVYGLASLDKLKARGRLKQEITAAVESLKSHADPTSGDDAVYRLGSAKALVEQYLRYQSMIAQYGQLGAEVLSPDPALKTRYLAATRFIETLTVYSAPAENLSSASRGVLSSLLNEAGFHLAESENNAHFVARSVTGFHARPNGGAWYCRATYALTLQSGSAAVAAGDAVSKSVSGSEEIACAKAQEKAMRKALKITVDTFWDQFND